MKKLLITVAYFMFLAFAGNAQADQMDFGLGFTAHEQSLWGGGPSGDFSVSGSTPGGIGCWWDIGASTGTVSGQFNGNLSVDHAESIALPGYTSLAMSYTGANDGGFIKSDLGAWASIGANVSVNMPLFIPDINWRPTLFSQDYGLNIYENFTPQIGTEISGQDKFSGYELSAGIPGVDVGLSFDVLQTDYFMPLGISGLMRYELSGETDFGIAEFIIDQSGVVNVDAYLNKSGTWSFSLIDMELDNEFRSVFGLGLTPYIDYPGGEWSPGSLTYNLFGSTPIELAFNDADYYNAFSIVVGNNGDSGAGDEPGGEDGNPPIPEPATIYLLCMGLAGLGCHKKRMKQRGRK